MRWTSKRKAGVVVAVRAGTVSAEELERQHGISAEELAGWMRAYDAYGVRGLKLAKPASTVGPQIAEIGIWRAAARLIRQHGAKAGIEAARLARMLDHGDGDGRRRWMRIRRAIKTLQARPKGKPN
jgi:transposase-like protein